MSPRLVDWTLAAAASLALATGILSLISGETSEWFVFALHGMFGLWLGLVLWEKLRRVWPRLAHPKRWEKRTVFGLAVTLLAVLALLAGLGWALGASLAPAGYTLLAWHIGLGIAVTLAISLHMVARAKPLRRRDLAGRRNLLRAGAFALGAMALWPAQQAGEHLLRLPGAARRFTGSYEAGSFGGNAFPTSSWVSDHPRPIAYDVWHARVSGAVRTPLDLAYGDVAGSDEVTATLDCTGGFFSTQRWRGLRVGTILDRAGLTSGARYVSFVSVTGYRWSLPLDEARSALLATHVGDEALTHEHGAPVRLVAPGRRGFEWVKWLSAIVVLTAPDPGQILSIYTSSFTPAGRGEGT